MIRLGRYGLALMALTLSALPTGAAHAAAAPALAAEPATPTASPRAAVIQSIGTTTLTIRYSRPGVKGRKIWDGVVPYGLPWRTGANEVTTFECSRSVRIAGKSLAAGTYTLYTIPGPHEWEVILSHAKGAWGPSVFSSEKDAARFKVKPTTTTHEEWMSFTFENLTPSSADLVLRWEKARIAVAISAQRAK